MFRRQALRPFATTIATTLLMLCSLSAHADISIKEPWVRATVPSQKATGAFMQISSTEPMRLTGAQSGAAKIVEIHEMRMEGDRMMMQAVTGIDLVPGKPLELRPGSYHIMLIDVVKPLSAGDKVALTLQLEDKDRKRSTVEVSAEVRPLSAARPAQMPMHPH